MRVLVTGHAGALGQVLVRTLLAWRAVSEIVGVDLRAGALRDPRLREARMDVRSPALAEPLAGCDALVHLAFVLTPGRAAAATARTVNVDGSLNAFVLAERAGVARAVFVSSAAVYGPWPGGPERLPETAPLQPRPGFHYAAHKAGVERWLERFKPEARLRIVRLRPPAILGAHAHPLLRTLLRQPFYPHLPGPPPRLQCVWEEDVALAVQAALAREVRGAFNLAAEPPLPFRALHRRSRRWALPVPLPLLRATLAAAGRAGLAAGDTAWVEGLRHGLVLDTGRARAELGWTPRLDTAGCVDATLSGAAPLDRAPGP